MRFRIVQEFDASPERVQEAYLDPAFLQSMGSLPKLGAPQLLSDEREGDVVRRRIRFHFAGDLNSAVRAVVDPAKLTWVEESTTSLSGLSTTWTIRPDHYADKLASSGQSRIETAGTGTRRVTTGEVKVKVFFVGPKVEAAIVSGMEEHAVLERDALAAHLGG
jgi:hypothetical protein